MRPVTDLAYSAKNNSGIRGFGAWYKTIPASISLLSAILIGLFGCGSPEIPSPTFKASIPVEVVPAYKTNTPAPIVPSTIISPTLFPLKVKTSLSNSGLSLNIQAGIRNPNSVIMEIDDIKVSALNAGGMICTQDTFAGGLINATSSKTFSFDTELPNSFLSESVLTLEIDTQTVNASTSFPIRSTAQINIPEVLRKTIVCPEIILQAHITKISKAGSQTQLEAQLEGSLRNPNPVDLNFTVLELMIKDKNGVQLEYVSIPGNSIPAKSDYTFKSSLMLPVKVLNQTEVIANAKTSVQFLNCIQSTDKNTAIPIPGLESLIAIPKMTINVEAVWNSNEIYIVKVKSLLPNDNDFALTTEDFQLKLYNNSSNLIMNSGSMSSKIIQGIPGSYTRSVIFQFNYLKEDIGRGIEALITGETKIGLEGVDEEIPIRARSVYKLTL